jgi:hypothetical protein
MRTFRAKAGPFAEQPFYKTAEIESICTEELQKLKLYPSDPAPVRIDRFIEKRFGVRPTYEDLPKGLLGFTKFGAQGVVEIVIAKALDEEGTVPAERRLRSTLAHEGGHGLLHAHLFAFGTRPDSLFGDGLASDSPKILCRDGGVFEPGPAAKKPPYRWWEFQANQAMGALLLPKALVERAVTPMLVAQGLLGLQTLADDRRERTIRLVAETFNVNPIVARIRLDALYPAAAATQLTL